MRIPAYGLLARTFISSEYLKMNVLGYRAYMFNFLRNCQFSKVATSYYTLLLTIWSSSCLTPKCIEKLYLGHN